MKVKFFLLHNSNKNTTTCHMNNPSFHHLNLSTKWICISSLCGNCLDEIFQCENGHVIDNAHYCDKRVQCEDGSDETSQSFGFRCSGKSRKSTCDLPQKNLYDSTSQCADGSDICFADGEFRCFLCLDEKLIISPKQVCDRNIDCFDGSDELLCSNQSVAQALVGEEGSRCPPGNMHCNSSTECVATDKCLCNFSVQCKDQINQRFCRHEQQSNTFIRCTARHAASENHFIPVIATRCDIRPECFDMEDECKSQCDPRPPFCDDKCGKKSRRKYFGNRVCDGYINRVMYTSDKCSREVEENCSMRFPCKSKEMVSIDIGNYCDGIFHCDNHSDETSIDCLNKRFNCTAAGGAISISKAFVCDGIKDCDQGEDESRQLCRERFYCENGKPISIDKKFVENGIKDCDTGLDECKTLFSDRYEMIANPVLRSLFWIMGFAALIGNLVTNILTLKEMFFHDKSNNSFSKGNSFVELANGYFIFNLTISDFLMGVYLLGVVSQGVKYSGHYCFVDKKWRSSNRCWILGTIATLSPEASALIMASMSTFRLVSIYKPFTTTTLKFKWIVVVGVLCWLFSFLFAFLPWTQLKSGYFVSEVWFPNHFFKSDTISKNDLITIANQVSGSNSSRQTWFKVKETILDKFQYNEIKAEFGFYSQTSVCMPRFYASTTDSAWVFSTFVITLNFILFIYMVVVYVLVYNKVTVTKFSTSNRKDRNEDMQKRISRL